MVLGRLWSGTVRRFCGIEMYRLWDSFGLGFLGIEYFFIFSRSEVIEFFRVLSDFSFGIICVC